MTGRQTISVVIPTKNSARLLPDCLESVGWADEIVVVDMHSEDATREVCAGYPQCRVFERDDYIFGNVNYGFEQATGDWVMRLDTDERITPELAGEIRAVLAAPPNGVTGYEFRERVFQLGRELRHGFGREHYRKMMFRRGAARYPLQSEHEGLETSGEWFRLRYPYDHLNYLRVSDYLEKANYYTDKDVERAELPEQPPSAWRAALLAFRLFYLYYVKWQGVRDGWIGFVDASMRSFYAIVEWAKLRERWERERGGRRAG
jgi:glycosyltransferase involved in cell wall biosynthesis